MSRSSLKLAISINAASNEVSFKSASVLGSFLPFRRNGWSVAQSSFPSPPVKLELKRCLIQKRNLLSGTILLANALVYLAPSLSYKLSSIASSVKANANAIVS